MKRIHPKTLMTSALAAAVLVTSVLPAYAARSGTEAEDAASESEQTDWTQAPPLLITEVATDQPSGKRYTYTEVYNNSDAPINFSDYTFYYCYQSGMGSGKVFEPSGWGSEGGDLIIEPGKTLVLWQSEGTSGRTVDDFNRFYGTNLEENRDIVRIPYSGIHASEKRGYFLGKDEDSIIVAAWSNAHGDEIAAGNPDKLAIQYSYPGTGRECTETGIAAATPGTVTEEQVPPERVHVKEQKPEISSVTAKGGDSLEVTAKIPCGGTPRAMNVTLHYRQKAGDAQTQYEDYKEIEMEPEQDGQSFTGTVPAELIYADEIQWYVTASYGPDLSAQSEEQTTAMTPAVPDEDSAAPLIITEVAANAESTDGGQYTYFEVYNQSDKSINLSYYKILYYYDYPAKTAAQSGKTWTLDDFTAMLEPGESMVYWLTSNGTTVDQFNEFYGTNLELGKDIVQVNYSGLHGTAPRWIRLGTSEEDAFTLAGFNETTGEYTHSRTALQYVYPHGNSGLNESIPAEVAEATPGTVEDWQVSGKQIPFRGYEGYPADDGQPPTLEVCSGENLPVPESIREGEELKVMYDVDLLAGATDSARLDAFKDYVDPDNPQNCPGGSEALKNRPYLIGTEILYKLDDAGEWTSIKEKTQWRLGHFLMQIPADILFGHDQVTFKVRAYTLYGMSETPESTVRIRRLNDTQGTVRLNVEDQSLLSGVTTVTANDGGSNENTVIQIDGQDAKQQNMLEDGAYFMVQTTGMNNYFKNAVTAPYGDNDRDILTILSPWCELPLSRAIHVDNKYFTYNPETQTYDVTLTIWAGDSGTPFEEIYDVVADENHEDFEVSGLQLKLANGKSYLPVSITPDNEKTNTDTSLDAWHTIGDSSGMVPYLEAHFQIPADEVTAVGTTLDTTLLEDGSHVITAVSGSQTATANVTVDNTAPAIDLGFAQDSTLYEPFVLEEGAVASDANGISEAALSLDGQPLTLPAVITPHDLAAGEHTIKAVVSDTAGNIAAAELRFYTEDVDPSVTDSDNDGITPTTANLTVSLEDQTADVAFLEGKSLTLENGGIVPAEGQASETSASGGNFPSQIFTVCTGETREDDVISVNWNGYASNMDASHPLNLYVFNHTQNTWELLGTADESGTIRQSFAARDHVAEGQASLLVQCATEGIAPEADSPAALTAEGTLSDWDGTGRPENYDFALAWETDTQYYSESFPYHYDNMNQWIVDHADDWKIRYVLHTGDIVDDVDMTGEWENADHSMKIFDEAGMPYGVLGGNHDVYAGAEGYGNYWKYFGEDRFQDKSYYGGSYKNNLGHYDLLTENGQDLLILYMSWDIYTDEIEWMNQVLQQYPDRKAIIALHRYTNVNAADDLLDYTGKLLRDQVVSKNPNVIAVLNGHYHGASIQTDAFDDNGDGIKERTVYQICTDYQSDPEGGSEYIKFLYFDLKNNKIYLNSYSPYRDDFNYFDSPKLENYGPGINAVNQDIAELDVSFDTADKTLGTNSISADLQTQKVIGSLSDVSGSVSFLWEGLEPETRYGWYASVTNDKLGITNTAVREFVTEALPETVTHTITAAAGPGGTISNAGEVQVADGGSITYQITPEAGYRVGEILVDGQPVEGMDLSYTFSQVAGDHTIEVTFEKIPQEDKADLSGLQEAVRKAEETDLTGYTDEQLADLNKLLDQAGEMLQNQNLTAADQPGIDQLTKDLLAALSSLPQKPGEENPGQTGGEPGEENPGQTGGEGGNNSQSGTSSGTGIAEGTRTPGTGDKNNFIIYFVMGGAAAAACVGCTAVRFRRKTENEE